MPGDCCPSHECTPTDTCILDGQIYKEGDIMPSDDICCYCSCDGGDSLCACVSCFIPPYACPYGTDMVFSDTECCSFTCEVWPVCNGEDGVFDCTCPDDMMKTEVRTPLTDLECTYED
eukprot:UN26075